MHFSSNRIFFIIPARSGSKGIPGKNRALFDYTAKLVSGYGKNVIVSSDDDIIKMMADNYGFDFVDRCSEFANDTANIRDVLIEVIEKKKLFPDDIIVMLYLTYPHRTKKDIQKAIDIFKESDIKSLLCKKDVKTHPYLCIYENGEKVVDHDLYRRQDYPACFEIAHYIFIAYADEISKLGKNLQNNETYYMYISDQLDCDNPEDLKKITVR